MTRSGRLTVISLTTVLLVAAVLGLVLNATAPAGSDLDRPSEILYLCNPLLFGLLGALLLVRRPDHPAGKLLLIIAVAFTADSLGKGIVHQWAGGATWTRGLLSWGAWLDNWAWLVEFGCGFLLLLSFPDGRLHGRFWKSVGWLGGAFVTGFALLCALQARTSSKPLIRLPFDLGRVSHLYSSNPAQAVALGGIVCFFVLALVSLGQRRRRAVGAERAQLRWLLWASAILVLNQPALNLVNWAANQFGYPDVFSGVFINVVSEIVVYGIPVSITVAVTRHGLFEIDRVIGRTVSYSLLTAVLALCYAVIITSATAVFPEKLGSAAVVGTTLIVFALFVPLRRRIQRVVDLRFNRRHSDAAQVVARFAEQVRVGNATTAPEQAFVHAVHEALEPAYLSVWLLPSAVR